MYRTCILNYFGHLKACIVICMFIIVSAYGMNVYQEMLNFNVGSYISLNEFKSGMWLVFKASLLLIWSSVNTCSILTKEGSFPRLCIRCLPDKREIRNLSSTWTKKDYNSSCCVVFLVTKFYSVVKQKIGKKTWIKWTNLLPFCLLYCAGIHTLCINQKSVMFTWFEMNILLMCFIQIYTQSYCDHLFASTFTVYFISSRSTA